MPKSSHDIVIPGLHINRKLKEPAYMQLYSGLQQCILNGQLRAGQRLPSSRNLAKEIGVSRNIVLLAYEQLELEGYITGAVGSGSFISEHIGTLNSLPQPVKAAPRPEVPTPGFSYPLPEEIITKETHKGTSKPFEYALPALDSFPYKTWIRCAGKVFRGFEFLNLGYDDAQGYYPLREVIATYLRTNRALHCEPEQIVITNGTQQCLDLIARLLIKKKMKFWMEDPGYGNAKAAFMEMGAAPCYVPVTSEGIDLDYAMKYHPDAGMAFVTPSHQFPLGGTMPVSMRLRLLKWAGKKDMWIIEDDYDSELRYSKKPIPALQGLDTHGKVIYLGTFSKVIFPGLRIGYMVLPDVPMAAIFAKGKAFLDRQNAITDQAILHEFISGGYFTIHLRKMRVLYKKRQDYLIALLQKYGKGLIRAEKQDSGMHLIGWLQDGADDRQIAGRLNRAGIRCIALSLYAHEQKTKPALILGYAGFNEKKLLEYGKKLIAALDGE
ncbi:MAG TPA: PLP-dependent aminotransferase family protein [Chitinophaga sp.]|uniref:MocR-like pyridoxine biosynthesis transcription factor PdxR n=1 Tax=Chitinophaga sp. TaxID=1869181 RepID=UPI002C983B21|nr:PLP-dependent aminotransferase family protein [Chitinophaga sp.]HVI43710.1 PLP-dependent aminotransferase family protein [Chitinophaga sp.]